MGLKDVIIPEGKEPKEYKRTERMAEIFRMMLEAGHPDLLSQRELAKRYGVSPPQINADMKTIKKELSKTLGEDADVITRTVYEKGIKHYVKEKKYKDAADILDKWNSWLFNRGAVKKDPQNNEQVIRLIWGRKKEEES